MNENKRTAIPFYIAGVFILAIAFGLGFYFNSDKPEQPEQLGVVSYNDGRKHIDLVGTGVTFLNSVGVPIPATGTTIYQFASSSDETYWGTTDFPQNLYGATTTSYFELGMADMWSLNGFYHATRTASQITIELAASDSAGCGNTTVSTNASVWFPLPITATTTPILGGIGTASTTATIIPGTIGNYEFSVPFEDVNYRCVQVKTYNGSTTDPSLLWLWATVRDK